MMDVAATMQPVQGKVVGVIIPPPEIRAVADKTAQFVAKNGKSFEQRILSSGEGKTAKFNFMKELDPYHAYYELRIREIEEAIAAGLDPSTVASSLAPKIPNNLISTSAPPIVEEKKKTAVVSTSAKAAIPNPIAMLAKSSPKEAPYPLEFCVSHPSGVTAVDVEIIKLTAQFTAINGREFLAGLAQREQRNPQFDFLKPTHLLFSYFTSLVDAYAKIVNPSDELKERMTARKSRPQVLQLAVQRWGWTRAEDERKREQQQREDSERASFAAVDWHDFSVVEVIDFREDELQDMPALGLVDLNSGMNSANRVVAPPPPMPPRPPAAVPRPPTAVAAPAPPPSAPAPSTMMAVDADDDDEIKVVSNYQPRIATNNGSSSSSSNTVIDPISGKPVPLDKLEEHMRIQLLDPKWKEQQRRFQEKQMASGSLASAEGRSIADALKTFAKRRGDIFGQGVGGDGTDSARVIAEEEQREREKYEESSAMQWDGHQGSAMNTQKMKDEISSGSAPSQPPPPTSSAIGPAMMAPQPPAPMSASFYPPQMSMGMPMMQQPPSMPLMYTAPPLPPPLIPTVPMMQPMMPPPPAMMFHPAPPLGDDHAAKKARLADQTASSLLSEQEWLARYPDPIQLQIQLPADGACAHWNLNGQMVLLVVSVTKTTKEVKEQLCVEHLNSMPVGKIQLKTAAQGFWKEGSTLAVMNIEPNALVDASLKARGGKR